MGEQGWLLGELLHQGELAGGGPAVVEFHLVSQAPRLCAALQHHVDS